MIATLTLLGWELRGAHGRSQLIYLLTNQAKLAYMGQMRVGGKFHGWSPVRRVSDWDLVWGYPTWGWDALSNAQLKLAFDAIQFWHTFGDNIN
jgi:hypothetical protein